MIGTYVRVDAAIPEKIPVAQLEMLRPNPGISGFLLNQSWSDVEPEPGVFDFRAAARMSEIAWAGGIDFRLRIVAGSHTPAFHMGRTWIPTDPSQGMGLALGLTLPCPFTPKGKINNRFLSGYRQMVTAASAWGISNGFAGLHVSQWGGRSAELCVLPELAAISGYNDELVRNAHIALLVVAQACSAPMIEFPIGGFAPKGFQAYFAEAMTLNSRPSYLSVNWLDDRVQRTSITDWQYGAEPPHNVQMVHEFPPAARGGTWNWSQVYTNAALSGAENVEVYVKSFFPGHVLDRTLLDAVAKAGAAP